MNLERGGRALKDLRVIVFRRGFEPGTFRAQIEIVADWASFLISPHPTNFLVTNIRFWELIYLDLIQNADLESDEV